MNELVKEKGGRMLEAPVTGGNQILIDSSYFVNL